MQQVCCPCRRRHRCYRCCCSLQHCRCHQALNPKLFLLQRKSQLTVISNFIVVGIAIMIVSIVIVIVFVIVTVIVIVIVIVIAVALLV